MDIKPNKNLPIGFFDSGVGGLSVLSRFKQILPNESTIYYGDTIHLPYGNKSKEELTGYARKILNFMSELRVKAVIIACNTSSAQAYDVIKNEYNFPIYPIIQCCAKTVAESGVRRIGVFATEATVKSGKYTEELHKYNPDIKVREHASKSWVSIVEKTTTNQKDIANIKHEIEEMLEFRPDKIILGCTHYPYLMNEFTKYADRELFIDPAEIFVQYIRLDLEKKNLISDTTNFTEQFFVSTAPEDFTKNAEIFYKLKKLPIIKELN